MPAGLPGPGMLVRKCLGARIREGGRQDPLRSKRGLAISLGRTWRSLGPRRYFAGFPLRREDAGRICPGPGALVCVFCDFGARIAAKEADGTRHGPGEVW